MNCTWKNCVEEGTHELRRKDGAQWAHLCTQHNTEMQEHIKESNTKMILRDWVLANGGAKKMSAKVWHANLASKPTDSELKDNADGEPV